MTTTREAGRVRYRILTEKEENIPALVPTFTCISSALKGPGNCTVTILPTTHLDIATALVQIMEGDTILGSGQLSPVYDANTPTYTAQISALPVLPVGSHTLTARFVAYRGFATAVSAPQTFIRTAPPIIAATMECAFAGDFGRQWGPSQCLITTDQGSNFVNQLVEILDGATVVAGGFIKANYAPTGGDPSIGAYVTMPLLSVGPHTLRAKYIGDDVYASSVSAPFDFLRPPSPVPQMLFYCSADISRPTYGTECRISVIDPVLRATFPTQPFAGYLPSMQVELYEGDVKIGGGITTSPSGLGDHYWFQNIGIISGTHVYKAKAPGNAAYAPSEATFTYIPPR